MKAIPLRSTDNRITDFALVDDEDFEALSAFRWCRCRSNVPGLAYARTGRHPNAITMHRLLLGLEKGDGREVDHWNHNGLDNRRQNLRVVTHAQNQQNWASRKPHSSRFRGVTFQRRSNNWRAEMKLDGRRYHLGMFATEEEAGQAAAEWREKNMPFAMAATV